MNDKLFIEAYYLFEETEEFLIKMPFTNKRAVFLINEDGEILEPHYSPLRNFRTIGYRIYPDQKEKLFAFEILKDESGIIMKLHKIEFDFENEMIFYKTYVLTSDDERYYSIFLLRDAFVSRVLKFLVHYHIRVESLKYFLQEHDL
jgi:hypothetical protein